MPGWMSPANLTCGICLPNINGLHNYHPDAEPDVYLDVHEMPERTDVRKVQKDSSAC